MKKTILAFSIAAALVALSGCSSFKMGAGCYVPHGVTGQCTATTVEPSQKPAGVTAPAAAQPQTAPRLQATGA